MSDKHLLGFKSLDAATMDRNECSSANLLTNVKHISFLNSLKVKKFLIQNELRHITSFCYRACFAEQVEVFRSGCIIHITNSRKRIIGYDDTVIM